MMQDAVPIGHAATPRSTSAFMLKLTLNRVFALSLLGLLAGLGLLIWLVFAGLQKALIESANDSRARNSQVIAESVSAKLGQAPAAVENFTAFIRAGLVKTNNPRSLRDGLLTLLLRNPDISEATFTYAQRTSFDTNGNAVIDPASVGQVDLFRARAGIGFAHRTTWYQSGRFLSAHTHIGLDGREDPFTPPAETLNPASHLTFVSPARRQFYGDLLWSDLHWFAVDADLPELQRRVEVSVQKALENPPGHFAGVLRIGLFTRAIDDAIKYPPSVDRKTHTIFLCVNDAHLIALPGSADYAVMGDDVRLTGAKAPPQVTAALALPSLKSVTSDHPLVSDQFITSGTTYLSTFRMLPNSRDWIVGMVVPRRAYLQQLLHIRAMVVRLSLLLVVVIALMGAVVLRAVSVAHSVILFEAARMNDFILDRSQNACGFHDINRVLSSLERAKTAMRAMGKYVPLDLVRNLYHKDQEPALGAEATELTVLFTDVQGFTAFAESADADTVAARLGAYLEVMVSVIQREKGTIDKFIGDSVMAFWNAPEPVQDHSALACRAALASRAALRDLYASPQWAGLPGFETRFGLHRCVASVGHFGAPERFNYTAIGDGINLASRLEGLNKHYGTSIISSAAFRDSAGPAFLFRRLDRVSVKGKSESLDIFELIGDASTPAPPHVAVYETALDAYLAGDFSRALALAIALPDDPPSLFLAARCRAFIAETPADWTGVHIFDSK